MFRYVHTNIIAKNSARLIDFYKSVVHCESIGETRDLRGCWLEKMAGIPNTHIVGEHQYCIYPVWSLNKQMKPKN